MALATRVAGRARRLVEEFSRFCRRLGGSARVKETDVSYIATCVLPGERHVAVDMWSWENHIEINVDGLSWLFRDLPEEKSFSYGLLDQPVEMSIAGRITPREGVVNAHGRVSDFTIIVDKDYSRVEVVMPGTLYR